MDKCIIPIELIDAILRCDLRNWNRLIRTCKRIHRALIGYREAAKSVIHRVFLRPIGFGNRCNVVTVWGSMRTIITILKFDDYWQMLNISHHIYHRPYGESINFDDNGIYSIHWYNNTKHLGVYTHYGQVGRRYRDQPGRDGNDVYSSRAIMMSKLDSLGIKYTWLKYLPDA